ncbi:MAG: N-acetylmuramoyl-L-alanine amidase [Cytophagales bacterium]|nr:MAG: N-acetylmuramoyl-L-alanine amidase [Cytophagales bacterium]TAF60610.1 MAG: N-acetylmuramoyl-L-alanine amidase [Cytophagales bacterium]
MPRIALRFLGFLLLSLCMVSVQTKQPEKKLMTVVLDAGHGGKDPGTLGRVHKHEKFIALSIVLALGKLINKEFPNVKVIYTRKTDVFIPLDERAAIANRNKADLFISVHCNASKNKSTYGTETYVMGTHKTEDNLEVAMRENASILQEEDYKKRYQNFDPNSMLSYIRMSNYQSANQAQSLRFAQKIESEVKNYAKRTSRGVKQSGFLVLWKTSMPSVLIETGFLTNSAEEKYLNTIEGQNMMANCFFRAFKSYKKEVDSK